MASEAAVQRLILRIFAFLALRNGKTVDHEDCSTVVLQSYLFMFIFFSVL